MRFVYLLFLLPFTASAQCDPEGILLELQATTDLNGLLFGETGCIEAVTIGSPLTFTGGTLDITTGNLTAGSTKVAVTGGTGAVIGAGATVDVVPGNILLSTLGGSLNLSQIAQGGATTNQLLQWNGTTWAPATISTGSGTVTSVGLTMPSGFSVGSSPVTTSGTIAVTTTLNGPLRGNGSGFTTGNTSLTSEVSGILPIANGGTNLSALGTANQLLRVNSGATALEYFTPSFLTGNQTITLSGDVTGSGTTAITTTIANNAVTVAKMQTLAGLSVLGRSANSTGNMAAITGTAANQYLRVNSGGTALEWGAITTGNLTAGSTKVAVTGGTGAVIGSGSTVDVVPGNILLSTLGGTLNLSQINQGGATLNQVMQWNGTTWAPATATATTDLTFSGASSPVTLNSSTGTDVTHTAGTGISLTGTSSNMTITNTLPDVTVSLTGAGINAVTGTYPNFTITGTEVDGSVSNEGSLTVGAGTSTTSIINSNTSGSTGVTLTAGTGLSISETGNVITLTNTSPDQTVSLTGAGITNVTGTYPNFTITSTEVDGSTTNELQTLSVSTNTTTLSNSGGSMTIAGGGINTVGTAGTTITITGTEVDGSISNEGSLTVGAGSGTTSIINSNTSGSTGVTITAGSGLTISETGNVITLANSAPDQTVSITGAGINAVTGTYPNFTITGTEVDGSVTNEAQTLSTSGTTSGILTLSTAGGAGGGTATIAAGTGITVAQSAGTITITNSSPATAGWLLDGNTIGSAKRIGSNDNFDVVVETNGTDRMWFDNAGTVSIGATQLTTAQLNISTLGATNTGMLISGGGSLVGPTFYSATGSGSGSTATVFSGVISMVSGNVEALVKNTSSTGSGGALITLNSHQSSTGDPKTYYTTNGTTNWTTGIDNSVSGDPFKITANSDLGGATPAISSTTANKVGVNQAAAVVTLQVTGTDAIGLPTGTTAQRSAAAIPQIRHNNTFSGLEFYDQNKNHWYRLTAVSTPSATSNTAAGTGHSGSILSGSLSSDVRGTLELNTGSSPTTGTVMTVTYASAFSGTKTVVTLTPANDQAATDIAKWRIDTQSNTGFTIRAVSALTASSTYTFNYYVGQ